MAVALYRKYRPRRFRDVIGQDAVTEALRGQTSSGHVGHSYIFTGIRGTGKTTLARILAKAVNCLEPKDGEPCGECEICRGIDDGSILDVSEIDAASNRGVDNIRELREETSYAPAVCRMRVYIIDEVHMLTTEAFNALLKIMEEPPAHVMFIFATTEIHKVPATILSRCQRYELKRIPADSIAAALIAVSKKEGIDLTDDGAALLARLSDGSMRDALSLLDTCSSLGGRVDADAVARLAGVADREYLFETADRISWGDAAGALEVADRLYQSSLDPVRLCTELLRHMRDLALARLAGTSLLRDCTADTAGRIKKQSERFSLPRLLGIMNELSSLSDRLATAPDPTLELQLALIKLCGSGSAGCGEAASPEEPKRISAVRSGGEAKVASKVGASEPAADPSSVNVRPEPESCGIGDSEAPPWVDARLGVGNESVSEVGAAEPAAGPARPENAGTEPDTDGADVPPGAGPKETGAEPDVRPAEHGDVGLGGSSGESGAAFEDDEARRQPESGVRAFPSWERVADVVARRNGMLGGYLRKTSAYISGDCVLIESDDFFRRLMNERDSSNKAILREAIEQVTGKRYKLGAYTPQNVAAAGVPEESERQLDELERLSKML